MRKNQMKAPDCPDIVLPCFAYRHCDSLANNIHCHGGHRLTSCIA